MVGDKVVEPKGVNRREIDPSRKVDPAKQRIAYYPANMMPPPDTPVPVGPEGSDGRGGPPRDPGGSEGAGDRWLTARSLHADTSAGAGPTKKLAENLYAADFKDVKTTSGD